MEREEMEIVFLCNGENDQETIQLAIDCAFYGNKPLILPSRE